MLKVISLYMKGLNHEISSTLRRLTAIPLLPTKRDMSLFINREEEIEEISFAIENNFRVLILGDRGIGKTSLFNRLIYARDGHPEEIHILTRMSANVKSPMEFIQMLMESKKLRTRRWLSRRPRLLPKRPQQLMGKVRMAQL